MAVALELFLWDSYITTGFVEKKTKETKNVTSVKG